MDYGRYGRYGRYGLWTMDSMDAMDSMDYGRYGQYGPQKSFAVMLVPSAFNLFRADRFALPPPEAILLNQKTCGAAGYGVSTSRRQPACKLANRPAVTGIAGEIVPFIGVSLVIIKFLGTVSVANVTPPRGANAVVTRIVSGDCRPGAGRTRVAQKRHQAVPFKISRGNATTKLSQCRIKIKQFNRAFAACST